MAKTQILLPQTKECLIQAILRDYKLGDLSYSRSLMELQKFMGILEARETIRKTVEED